MMSWLPALVPALAVLAVAACLVAVERRTGQVEADWVRTVVRRVNPVGYEELADRAEDELDLSSLEKVPALLRPLCPAPPFVAAVYHHTCGSCRELWREVGNAPDLAAVHLVYGMGQEEFLHRRGLLRPGAFALPDELMAQLPSGLAIRVDADWRIAEMQMATTAADLRHLLGEAARSR